MTTGNDVHSTALVPTTNVAVKQPQNSTDELSLKELSTALSNSKYFPDALTASQTMTKLVAARELGFGTLAGLTGIYVVKGRLSLSANLMASCVHRSGNFRYRVKKLTNVECSIEFHERDPDSKKWETVGISTFTADDAKLAGLLTGDNYRKYPRNMLYARAMSNGCRWFCPSVFAGSPPYLPDELPDSNAKMQEDGEFIIDAEIVTSYASSRVAKLAELQQLITQTNTEGTKLLAHYKKKSFESLDDAAIDNAINNLKSKLAVS